MSFHKTVDGDPTGSISEKYIADNIELEGGEKYAASITQDMLEVICPNGETEYFFEKFNSITEQEALDLLIPMIEFHSDDWNFPNEMMSQMKLAAQGKKVYGENYDRDIRINCYLLKYSSPYPEVRSVSKPIYEDVPIETIRAYFLGISWAICGTVVNTFFTPRFPSIGIAGSTIQIILYPMGKLAARLLPDWGVTIWRTRHSLNPGPWTFKEQMFATITYNIAIYTTNSFNMIAVQKMPMYYGNTFVNFGYQLMLTLFIQLIGMSFAGILRRFAVYPVKAIWPYTLQTVALNRALSQQEERKNIHGWTLSRYRFFVYVFGGAFLYYWIPGYLFKALSTFNCEYSLTLKVCIRLTNSFFYKG